MRLKISLVFLFVLFACVCQTSRARKRLRPRLREGDGINFPKQPLSKAYAARYVFNRRLFSIYRVANPPLGSENARDLELVYNNRSDGNLDEPWDARFGGNCTGDVWLYETIQGEGNRAVYTYDGPFPTTGEGITISFFSCSPEDYIFIFFCLDRTKEIVRLLYRAVATIIEGFQELVCEFSF